MKKIKRKNVEMNSLNHIIPPSLHNFFYLCFSIPSFSALVRQTAVQDIDTLRTLSAQNLPETQKTVRSC